MNAAAIALRLLLGLILLATGLGKLLDVEGFAQVIATYQLAPETLLLPIAVVLILLELRLSENLLLGKSLCGSAAASTLLHAFFASVAVITLLRGIDVPNCGCFGIFLARPLTWTTVAEDTVLIIVSLVLYVIARRGEEAPA